MAGTYAGTSIWNYVHGVRAWHIIHGIQWLIDKATFDTMVQGEERLQPERACRKKRLPYTLDYITQILGDLNQSGPLDVAYGGCLTTSFFCAAQVGELTVPTLKDFDPSRHVMRARISRAADREDLYFSKQLGEADPDTWLQRHLQINNPNPIEHLVAYSHTTSNKSTRKPLTKSTFMQQIHKAAKKLGLPIMQGHGIRIGATLEYLLRGVPFDAVKVIGCWKSDAFLLYLCKHAEIMVLYMQPELHRELMTYTMPPVRCECTPTTRGIHGR